jgi:hypothetical protein
MRYLLLLILLAPTLTSTAQEQVSFAYDTPLFRTYPVTQLYEHEGQLRYLSVEENGEIIISTHFGNSQDTLLIINENQDDLPYDHFLKNHRLAQFYDAKIVVVDLLELTVDIVTLPEPTYYNYRGIREHFVYFYKYQDTLQQVIRLDDLSQHEIPLEFNRSADKDHLVWVNNNSSPKNVLTWDATTGLIDTVFQSPNNLTHYYQKDRFFISEGTNFWKYDPVSSSLQSIFTFSGNALKDVSFFRDELLMVENTSEGATFTSLDLNGILIQEFTLSEMLPFGIYHVLAKDGEGNYVYQDYNFDVYTTNAQDSIVPLTLGYQPRIFEGGIDSLFFFIEDNLLSQYDVVANQATVLDTALGDLFGSDFNLLIYQGAPYLSIDEHLFADLDQAPGMEDAAFRTYRPKGLKDEIGYIKNSTDLYLQSGEDLFWLNGAVFEPLEAVRLFEGPKVLDDQLYFSGKVNNVFGFYRIDNWTEPILLQDKGRDPILSASGDYLLLRHSGLGNADFYVLKAGVDTIASIELPQADNFRILEASFDNTMFAYVTANDTVTVWSLDLENNQFTELFNCKDIDDPHMIQDKLIVPIRDHDGFSKLLFYNYSTGTIETFQSDLTDPFIGVYKPNCDQSLLFEVTGFSGGVRQIWSTDGTLENTQFQVENAPPYLLEYFDLALHKNDDQLFFSIRTSETELDHFVYDCETMTLELENYPSDITLARRFQAGNALFGVSIDAPHPRNLMDINDSANPTLITELGKFRENFVWIGVGTGFIYNVSEGLPFSDDIKTLAILSIDPFGQELYYVYEDGTLEQLADLNPGIADAFLSIIDFSIRTQQTRTTIYQDHLYFDAYNRLTGHQIYRLPLEGLIGTSTTSPSKNAPLRLSLYPNPIQNNLNMTITEREPFKWFIYSNDGILKRTGEGQGGTLQLNVTDLPTGAYYFFIEINGRRLAKAFVKAGN